MKITSIDAPKNSSEKLVFSNLRGDREKQTPNFHLGQLVRTADTKKALSKADSTNWIYNKCKNRSHT